MTPDLVPEIPEAVAVGVVADVYADIRDCIGVPMVNLMYRYLATEPGRLEAAWNALRPNILDEWTEIAVGELRDAVEVNRVVPISKAAIAVAGVHKEGVQLARNTVAVYNQANPRNLLAVCALLQTRSRQARSRSPKHRAPSAHGLELLPMEAVPVRDLHLQALLEEISRAMASPREQLIIPSLFRHFASRPYLLALVWTAVKPVFAGDDGFAQASNVLARAQELTESLPYPLDFEARFSGARALAQFPTIIARMIVAGSAIARALDGSAPNRC